MSYLNLVSLVFGVFGICFVAWLFSEDRRVVPWRVIIWGIGLQLVLGAAVFLFPPTRVFLDWFNNLLNVVFDAADRGARFVFGNAIVPDPSNPPDVNLGYIFAFRALPTVIFFSGLMALLDNLGLIKPVVNFFGEVFYQTMRLSGAEALSGSANIFVGIEAAIVVKPFLAKMTRSELCAILACCFGTAASSVLAIYVSFLKPVFPNILGHLVSASIIAIPACFVLSKIMVPEVGTPLTMGGIPKEEDFKSADGEDDDEKLEAVGGELMKRTSPLDAAILGSLDGVKMSVSIAAVLILILGLVYLLDALFAGLATIPGLGSIFQYVTLDNITGVLFYPLTLMTGISWDDSWQAAVIIGSRLFKTAIPAYGALAAAAQAGEVSDRTVLIVSYALSGFAHVASVGIFVGGTIALIPSRRKEISELGWKAMFIGTLACMMIASIAGFMDTGNPSILGIPAPEPEAIVEPAPETESTTPPTATDTPDETNSTTTPDEANTPANSNQSN
jgi:CNT family concentrative nucleoside transporter